MDILGAYDQLKACLEAQGIDVPIQDNLILKPRTLPAVVIEPVASLLLLMATAPGLRANISCVCG